MLVKYIITLLARLFRGGAIICHNKFGYLLVHVFYFIKCCASFYIHAQTPSSTMCFRFTAFDYIDNSNNSSSFEYSLKHVRIKTYN